jgi:hypothetical protein
MLSTTSTPDGAMVQVFHLSHVNVLSLFQQWKEIKLQFAPNTLLCVFQKETREYLEKVLCPLKPLPRTRKAQMPYP